MPFLRIGAGIRGVVGNGLDRRNIMQYLSALGTWLDEGDVGIVSDTRFSTPMLKAAAVSCLSATGCRIHDLGIAPAPLLHFYVASRGLAGGCILGAGHHLAGWNAMMAVNDRATLVNASESQAILDIFHSQQFAFVPWDRIGTQRAVDPGMADAYLDTVLADLDVGAIQRAGLTVVTDCCNGSASPVLRLLMDRLAVRQIAINDELSGILPHTPEPRPRAAYQAKALMQPVGADIGFVLNSDGSRLSIVSDVPETVSEERTFPLVANWLLQKAEQGQTVVTNVCATRILDEIVNRYGGALVRTPVGLAWQLDRMLGLKALVAGDGMGSVAYNRGIPGVDALRSAAILLEAMAVSGKRSRDLVADLPQLCVHKKTIPCQPNRAYQAISLAAEAMPPGARIDRTDGFRFEWDAGWLHLRASDTEPVVRLITEWPSQRQADDMAERVKRLLVRTGV